MRLFCATLTHSEGQCLWEQAYQQSFPEVPIGTKKDVLLALRLSSEARAGMLQRLGLQIHTMRRTGHGRVCLTLRALLRITTRQISSWRLAVLLAASPAAVACHMNTDSSHLPK